MSVGLKDFLTVSVKPHQIQIDIMNNNSFFELCFMVTVIYYYAAILTGAGNIPLFLPDNWKLNISENRNISENFFNKLKIEKSINR